MFTRLKNIPVRRYVNKPLKVITSPEVVLVFGIIGAGIKMCHEIVGYLNEHRRPMGFRK
jgi:hypothetical protein